MTDKEFRQINLAFANCILTVMCVAAVGMLSFIGLKMWESRQVHRFKDPVPAGWRMVGGQATITNRESGIQYTRLIRHDNVNRVFMHESDWYTLYLSMLNTTELTVDEWRQRRPKIFADVPEGESMWAQYRQTARNERTAYISNVEIHIHSNHIATDIVGAGWERNIEGRIELGSTAEVGP